MQPWHAVLCRWGVPKAPAVLLIYLLFFAGLVLVGLLVVPVLVDQVTPLVAQFPEAYEGWRRSLRGSGTLLLRLGGERLPPLEALLRAAAGVAPNFYQSVIGFTASLVTLGAYAIAVLATAVYWTLELPRVERLAVSFVPAPRRAETLNVWHEIEYKLGAFVRGQALAMLVVGVASAVGYFLLGLPNVLALSVLAGLLEAVPLIGPILAAVPAVLVALPLGPTTVALVIAWAMLLQVLENNLLIPRIMSHAVGVSALVGMFAVIAFGTLYGIVGVFIAIPLTAVIQVLLDRVLINVEPPAAPGEEAAPLAGVRARFQTIKRQARQRLRERGTRMGIDPASGDHVADAVDQRIEAAVGRVEDILTEAQETDRLDPEHRDAIIDELHQASDQLEAAVERVDAGGETPPQDAIDSAGEVEQAVERVESVAATTQRARRHRDPT